MIKNTLCAAAFLLLTAAAAGPAELLANARHFTYTYESAVLPAGEREIEIWHTEKLGRNAYYHGIDQRLELEWGITDRLQGAVYFNFSSEQSEDENGAYRQKNKLYGSSLELKYRILDRAVSPFGLAFYGEVLSKPHETEAEAKLIMDKKIGPFLFALNLVGEREWLFKEGKNETEDTLAGYAGISYGLTSALHLGVEFSNVNEFKKGEGFEKKAFYGGPVFSYDAGGWWYSMTVMPKWKEIKKEEENEARK